jgi:hypothetical protein
MEACRLTFDFWCWDGREFAHNRGEMAMLLRMDGYAWSSVQHAIRADTRYTAQCGVTYAIRRLTKEEIDDRWKQYARDGRAPKVTLI